MKTYLITAKLPSIRYDLRLLANYLQTINQHVLVESTFPNIYQTKTPHNFFQNLYMALEQVYCQQLAIAQSALAIKAITRHFQDQLDLLLIIIKSKKTYLICIFTMNPSHYPNSYKKRLKVPKIRQIHYHFIKYHPATLKYPILIIDYVRFRQDLFSKIK